MQADIIRLPQNEDKDSRYARAHKILREKYNLRRSRGTVSSIPPALGDQAQKPKRTYTGYVKLSTGMELNKEELTNMIKLLLPSS